MNVFEPSAAYIADWIFGDPPNYPHPVKVIGKAIQFLEKKFLYKGESPTIKRLLGVILFTYTTLATRNLYDEAKKVIKVLEQSDLGRARKEVGFLVSRDTAHLDEKEVCRALIETVSENTSDGIIAPLFYLAIGGPPLAMAYKAINTLDSMVGYENDRYRYLGWASAKVDDWANFIPARITAFLFILSSLILGKNWKMAWRVTWRDGPKNTSPNSGYPEAAVAGALGIQLGGENVYFGKPKRKPMIGEPENPINIHKAKESLHLMIVTSLMGVIVTSLFFSVNKVNF